MRNRIIVSMAVLAVLSGTTALAQTQYDAARLIDTDLNGTARFVGMGGAMGALGGDITTIATNPAGIGVFRRNDISLTLGLNNSRVEASMGRETAEKDRTRLSFDQVGCVFSTKFSNDDPLRYVNFAFNYRKQRNFNKAMTVYGDLYDLSQTGQIAQMAADSRITGDDYDWIYDMDPTENYFGDSWMDVAWLSVMGIQSELILPGEEDGKWVVGYYPVFGEKSHYTSRETGGVNVYDFNLSGNLNDRFFWGFTVGYHDVNYDRTSTYWERGFSGIDASGIASGEYDYTLRNSFSTEGDGVNLKLGIIFRPIESSPFRVGLAIHTPTFYKLTDSHSAAIASYVDGLEYNNETPIAVTEYELQTPWKFNFSLGHTIGTSVALGAEYEYTDYSSAELSYDGDTEMYDENQWIDEDLKGVHTFRFGIEAKLVPEFSLRAGYNYSTASFSKNAYKYLFSNSTRTDTEYENMLDKNIFTVGMGWRYEDFYIDAAYQYCHQKSEFYAFDNLDLKAGKLKNERNQFMVTAGYRF